MKGQVRLEINDHRKSVSFVFRLNDFKFALNYRDAILDTLSHDTVSRKCTNSGTSYFYYRPVKS